MVKVVKGHLLPKLKVHMYVMIRLIPMHSIVESFQVHCTHRYSIVHVHCSFVIGNGR